MAGEHQGATWPLPKFYFSVDFGNGIQAPFQEVSGLATETEVIEYRHGDNPAFSTVKMPGIAKLGNVTLKRGVIANDNQFWHWYSEIKMNTIQRRTVVINLLDEAGKPTMKWTLTNAWPTKLTGTDLRSDSNEVVIDTLELTYESLTISNG